MVIKEKERERDCEFVCWRLWLGLHKYFYSLSFQAVVTSRSFSLSNGPARRALDYRPTTTTRKKKEGILWPHCSHQCLQCFLLSSDSFAERTSRQWPAVSGQEGVDRSAEIGRVKLSRRSDDDDDRTHTHTDTDTELPIWNVSARHNSSVCSLSALSKWPTFHWSWWWWWSSSSAASRQ